MNNPTRHSNQWLIVKGKERMSSLMSDETDRWNKRMILNRRPESLFNYDRRLERFTLVLAIKNLLMITRIGYSKLADCSRGWPRRLIFQKLLHRGKGEGATPFPWSLPHNAVLGACGVIWRCPWCNCYRRRKWTRQHEFKSWTRLIAFHIALIPLGKVWIQLFSLQLLINSRTD